MSDKVREALQLAARYLADDNETALLAFVEDGSALTELRAAVREAIALLSQGAEERREAVIGWIHEQHIRDGIACFGHAAPIFHTPPDWKHFVPLYAAPPSTPTAAVAQDECPSCRVWKHSLRMIAEKLGLPLKAVSMADVVVAIDRLVAAPSPAQEAEGSAERGAAAAPEYVMVPREPTEAMIDAGRRAQVAMQRSEHFHPNWSNAGLIWRSMLDASQPGAEAVPQQQPAATQGEGDAAELLPCPFCGGAARPARDDERYIICANDDCDNVSCMRPEQWNRRASLPEASKAEPVAHPPAEDAARIRRETLDSGVKAIESQIGKAHTYASENADVYRAFDRGLMYAVAVLRAHGKQEG